MSPDRPAVDPAAPGPASGAGSGVPVIPPVFAAAVGAMDTAPVRTGITVTRIRAPQRLARFSHAVGLEIDRGRTGDDPVFPVGDGDGDAFGRLILLHDPAGDGEPVVMRLVAYLQADMDAATVGDPLLPEVAWDWLTDGLAGRLAPSAPTVGYRDLGGTVTSTTSVRHGDISGPPLAFQLELRASWTATDPDLAAHVTAFAEVLATVAGLPPAGVAVLPHRGGH